MTAIKQKIASAEERWRSAHSAVRAERLAEARRVCPSCKIENGLGFSSPEIRRLETRANAAWTTRQAWYRVLQYGHVGRINADNPWGQQ